MLFDNFPLNRIRVNELLSQLSEIPDAPERLYVRGTIPSTPHTYLSVVGSREYTHYGKQMCEKLIAGLRGYPIVIVSGLALGIDGIAHRAALSAGLTTVAVPGSGLDERVLYPASHRHLAKEIIEAGGALISEFEPMWKPRKESFPQRNRIMAGISRAVLVVEATERSGTLITARLAADYSRDVFAVPGPVHSETSKGPHMLLKRGAALIETSSDILEALAIPQHSYSVSSSLERLTKREQDLCTYLSSPRDRDELLNHLHCSIAELNTLLSSLELRGILTEQYGKIVLTIPTFGE